MVQFSQNYSGIETSTGLHALLSNRCRNVADRGLSDLAPPTLLNPAPPLPPAAETPRDKIPSLTFSDSPSLNGGGDDTNKSLSFWLTTKSFPFSGEFLSFPPRSGKSSSRRDNLRLALPERLSSMRSVFLRRRCITGLADGLLVGLPATAHCVARNLNFCNVAMITKIKSTPEAKLPRIKTGRGKNLILETN